MILNETFPGLELYHKFRIQEIFKLQNAVSMKLLLSCRQYLKKCQARMQMVRNETSTRASSSYSPLFILCL